MMRRLPAAITATLGRFRESLERRFGSRLREVRLFGSWARGEAGEESDVDVLVTIDDLSAAERHEVYDLAYRADLVNDWLVLLSPLPYSTEQAATMRAGGRRLIREIDEQGVAL
jgi:predicted nucleotidyltransferase